MKVWVDNRILSAKIKCESKIKYRNIIKLENLNWITQLLKNLVA